MRIYYSYPGIESAYETVQDEGSSLPQQTILDFQGAGVTVSDGGTKTIVTIPGGGSVTAAALTKTDDTNVTLTLGGTPATALLQAVSLTVGWTGTLADARIASAAYWNAKFTLPSLTTGSVLFSDGTTIAQDNANFFWDDTNNRLGIGTSTPTARLHVKASGTGYNTALLVTDSAATNQIMMFDNSELYFNYGTAYQTLKHTSGRWDFPNVVTVGGPTNTGVERFQVKGQSSDASSYAIQAVNSSNTVLLTVRNDGNVGIGLSSPTEKLEVSGNIQSSGSVRVNDGTGSLIFRQATATAADPCIFLFNNQTTAPTATNYILKVGSANSGNTFLNGNGLIFAIGGTNRMSITNGTTQIGAVPTASGALTSIALQPSSNTNQTASTEQLSFNVATCTSQHATGALTTQRFAVINAPTYSFVGASTITNAATLAVTAAPIAGTNATITNAYALWVQGGKSLFAGNIELTQTVTTETVVSNRTVTIVINGTTYKLLAVI